MTAKTTTSMANIQSFPKINQASPHRMDREQNNTDYDEFHFQDDKGLYSKIEVEHSHADILDTYVQNQRNSYFKGTAAQFQKKASGIASVTPPPLISPIQPLKEGGSKYNNFPAYNNYGRYKY